MATVLVLTARFPSFASEQFLALEVPYWTSQDTVIFAPKESSGDDFDLPGWMVTDMSLAQMRSRPRVLLQLAATFFSPVFWREVRQVWHQGLRIAHVLRALKSCALMILARRGIEKIVQTHGEPDVVYAYWNDVESYGAVLAKAAGLVPIVITRAHRYDVYPEQRGGYLPLRRQLGSGFDAVYPISRDGRELILQDVPGLEGRVHVQRLGVEQAKEMTPASPDGCVCIVSISNCVPVKRLNLLIDALARAAEQAPDIQFEWTHLGDGPLRSSLATQAMRQLGTDANIRFSLPGALPNDQVHAWLSTHGVDFIVNTSESEGIPVSLMEAMAHGIPALATAVGGVPELVTPECGLLISPETSADELAVRLIEFASRAKEARTRAAAQERISDDFNAAENFPMFVERVHELIETRNERD